MRGAFLGRTSLGIGLFLATVVAGFITAGHYGIASDVGNYFEDSLKQLRWLRSLGEGILALDPGAALSREVVFEHWRWWPERIPHPPLSRQLSGTGYALFGSFLEPLVAYRVAVIVVYGLLVSGAALFVSSRRSSLVAGLATGLTLLTLPALFAYGHLANTDMFLTAFWFGSVAALDVHLERGTKRWLWLSALLAGCAMATKFTGLLVVPALLIWLLIQRAMNFRNLMILGSGALVVLFVTNPVFWVAPLVGVSDYLIAGLGRTESPLAQITTLYFGKLYTYRGPWHYPFVWTLIVIPLPILLAIIAGTMDRRGRQLVLLAAVNLFVLYAVLLLPGTPLHDGVRLFLPVFPFLAILAGLGVERFTGWLYAAASRRVRMSRDFTGAVLVLIIFCVPAIRTVEYHPHQLSYFNALIGGIQGAERRGLEVTNQKEVLSPDVLKNLAQHLPSGSVVNPGFFLEELCFYQAQGYAPAGWVLEGELGRTALREPRAWVCMSPDSSISWEIERPPRDPDFVFVLNRPGQYTFLEWLLSGYGGTPYYELRVRGVPLFQVFRVGERDES